MAARCVAHGFTTGITLGGTRSPHYSGTLLHAAAGNSARPRPSPSSFPRQKMACVCDAPLRACTRTSRQTRSRGRGRELKRRGSLLAAYVVSSVGLLVRDFCRAHFRLPIPGSSGGSVLLRRCEGRRRRLLRLDRGACTCCCGIACHGCGCRRCCGGQSRESGCVSLGAVVSERLPNEDVTTAHAAHVGCCCTCCSAYPRWCRWCRRLSMSMQLEVQVQPSVAIVKASRWLGDRPYAAQCTAAIAAAGPFGNVSTG